MHHSTKGCTLEDYAAAKQLPVAFLQELGLKDQRHQGHPAIRIPYMDESSREDVVQYRTALEGKDRFRWRSGSKPALYGQWKLSEAKDAGYVVLVEGASDVQTAWFHGLAALGVPGASLFSDAALVEHLQDIDQIFLRIEPDAGGEQVLKWLATSALREKVYLVALGESKDLSAFHLLDPATFSSRWEQVRDRAQSWNSIAAERADLLRQGAHELCSDLQREPDILERFTRDLTYTGVVGESKAAALIYLAVTTRVFPKPVSFALKGPSSAGKSYLLEKVLSFFPDAAYYALSAMSERALVYSEEPLQHRFMVVYEAAGMEGDLASYLFRSLLSEHCVRYETVEKTSEGMVPRLIHRPGPTGLATTTTKLHLHPENETRLLSIPVNDSATQTAQILECLALESKAGGPPDEWRALQTWIASGAVDVVIPYALELAKAVPTVAVRLRRDFGAVLALIKAHALLHQCGRHRDHQGRIIATIEDYARVREIVADLVGDGVEATVQPSMRENVRAVETLQGEDGCAVVAVGKLLGLDKSAASRRCRAAIDRGYIKNMEERRGRPTQLKTADPLPDDLEILPSPDKLSGCTVAVETEGVKTTNIFFDPVPALKSSFDAEEITQEEFDSATGPLLDFTGSHGKESDQ